MGRPLLCADLQIPAPFCFYWCALEMIVSKGPALAPVFFGYFELQWTPHAHFLSVIDAPSISFCFSIWESQVFQVIYGGYFALQFLRVLT